MSMKVVGDMSEWSGMLSEVFRQAGNGEFTPQQLQAFLEHRNDIFVVDAPKKIEVVEKKLILPDLDNAKIFSELGLKAQYKKIMAGMKSPPDNTEFWYLLVPPEDMEIPCDVVTAKFRELGVTTSLRYDNLDFNLKPEYEVREAKGAHWLAFKKSLTGEATSQSANQRWEDVRSRYRDPRLCDGLRLMFGAYLASGKEKLLLNIEKWTRTRSRFRDGDVASFNAYHGKVRVSYGYPVYAYPDARVRPADFLPLEPSGAKV